MLRVGLLSKNLDLMATTIMHTFKNGDISLGLLLGKTETYLNDFPDETFSLILRYMNNSLKHNTIRAKNSF